MKEKYCSDIENEAFQGSLWKNYEKRFTYFVLHELMEDECETEFYIVERRNYIILQLSVHFYVSVQKRN